jgi:1-deoxy-D-xylulose-5-phosphate reductoisomerase
MVAFTDGATIAQLSHPDMRGPIAYALAYPARSEVAFGALDWSTARTLEFEPPDLDTFRPLRLAFAAGRAGGSAPAWLNAANEVAVAAFLDGNLSWAGIAEVLEAALDLHDGTALTTVDDVIEVDRQAREVAGRIVEKKP